MTESELHDSNFRDFVRCLTNKDVLVYAQRDITRIPHLHGDDFYMLTLVQKLRAAGISIDIAVPSGGHVLLYRQHTSPGTHELSDIVKNYDTIVLDSISPMSVVISKFRYRIEIIALVFFLSIRGRAGNTLENIRGIAGNTLWQVAVNAYVVSSARIAQGLRKRGIRRAIYCLPPTYSCSCNMGERLRNFGVSEGTLPKEVKVVYIGSLYPNRFSVDETIAHLRSDTQREYELTVYTATSVEEKTWKDGNVTVQICNKLLTENEKCSVLRSSQIFVAPNSGTTMDPPISVIEARYHGNLILQLH